jgi:multiple sugar transport system ATP-binding protein
MGSVEVTGLTKIFPPDVLVLDNLDITINDGEFFSLLGPSGCGKTTLLRTIAGLESASAGQINIGDRTVTHLSPGKRNVAMVFQDYALYPHMTVRDNIAYPLKVQRVAKAERFSRAESAAESLSLGKLLERRPSQLSGGQQQRAALARAMACRPDVFLLDEPLSNLDARLRLEARGFLKELQSEIGVTTVFVTHDQSEALALSDRMAVLSAGKIMQIGTPREFFHAPSNVFVAEFIGMTPINIIPASISDSTLHFGGMSVQLAEVDLNKLHGGRELVVGIRPEYLHAIDPLSASSNIEGTVRLIENLGTHHMVSIDVDQKVVRGLVPDGHEPSLHESIRFVPTLDRLMIFDSQTGEALIHGLSGSVIQDR